MNVQQLIDRLEHVADKSKEVVIANKFFEDVGLVDDVVEGDNDNELNPNSVYLVPKLTLEWLWQQVNNKQE